jgi:hypothetical protein
MRKAQGTTGSIRQSADADEHTIQARGEQRLAVAIEPRPACSPIRSEPFHLPEPLGKRVGPQHVKATRQGIEHRLEPAAFQNDISGHLEAGIGGIASPPGTLAPFLSNVSMCHLTAVHPHKPTDRFPLGISRRAVSRSA